VQVTIAELKAQYGTHWLVSDAVGGGWYAVRRHGLAPDLLKRGLSNVHCAATIDELAARLTAEMKQEERLLRSCEALGHLPRVPEPSRLPRTDELPDRGGRAKALD
jgi:hypothetical protein